MTSTKKNRILPMPSVMIFCLFVAFVASPCMAWETKDPQLAEDFAQMLGFKVKDKVGKVAPDIKPGMVIDSSNYTQYPGLKELLPESRVSCWQLGYEACRITWTLCHVLWQDAGNLPREAHTLPNSPDFARRYLGAW